MFWDYNHVVCTLLIQIKKLIIKPVLGQLQTGKMQISPAESRFYICVPDNGTASSCK